MLKLLHVFFSAKNNHHQIMTSLLIPSSTFSPLGLCLYFCVIWWQWWSEDECACNTSAMHTYRMPYKLHINTRTQTKKSHTSWEQINDCDREANVISLSLLVNCLPVLHCFCNISQPTHFYVFSFLCMTRKGLLHVGGIRETACNVTPHLCT